MITDHKSNDYIEKDVSDAKHKGFIAGLMASLVAAFAANLCCLAPLLYLLFGTSMAGMAWLQKLAWLQWPMIAASLVLLGMGFWRLYLSGKPYCHAYLSLKAIRILFWVNVFTVATMLFYPYYLPFILELMS